MEKGGVCMRDIKSMSVEEMAAEIRSYPFERDRGYAFVSYSHRDRALVYPLVLSWLRAGFNIYIDLDFERHGSDSNWADLMLSTLSSRLCRLGICFKSVHYRYSYASLLELLTMRGETVTNRHSGKMLYVDSVALEAVPDEDEIPERYRELYAEAFRGMSSGMGERFLGQNPKEAALLREGLEFWLSEAKTRTVLRSAITAEKMMNYIQDSYRAGHQDFYPQIAYLVKNWFISQDLNGNDYTLDSSLAIRLARFSEVRVEQVRESLLPKEETWTPRRTVSVPAEPAPVQPMGPYLVRKSSGEQIQLTRDRVLLGRDGACDYVIAENKAVSHRHALLVLTADGWTVTDQGAKNGTFVNGKRLTEGEPTPIRSGDSIRLGAKETFTFHE